MIEERAIPRHASTQLAPLCGSDSRYARRSRWAAEETGDQNRSSEDANKCAAWQSDWSSRRYEADERPENKAVQTKQRTWRKQQSRHN